MSSVEHASRQWHFFTNHFHVLLVVARHLYARLRAVADEVGITERAAHRILRDLSRAGYLIVTKRGRGNHYRLNEDTRLRRALNRAVPLAPLVRFINENARDIHPRWSIVPDAPLGPADARSGG